MTRPTAVALGLGLAGGAALVGLALLGQPVMPSYLGAWLFVLALPLGALPVVMACELLDVAETGLMAALRRLVAVMPLAALLAIPVLLRLRGLYPSLASAGDGLPGLWMTVPCFAARAVLFLLAWSALGLVFARPAGRGPLDARRPSIAGVGLGLHFVMGTLAADDWVEAVEPGFNSSAFGLLFIAAQGSVAVSLAVVMTVTGRRGTEKSRILSPDRRDVASTRHVATALAVLLAGWGFLAFTQYLVVWSANLPKEVAWYQHRAAGLGLAAECSAGLLCALALAALLVHGTSRHAGVLASVAAALLVMHGLEMLWLVTPAFRSAFTLTAADGAAAVAAAGLGIGSARLFGERSEPGRMGHGAA